MPAGHIVRAPVVRGAGLSVSRYRLKGLPCEPLGTQETPMAEGMRRATSVGGLQRYSSRTG